MYSVREYISLFSIHGDKYKSSYVIVFCGISFWNPHPKPTFGNKWLLNYIIDFLLDMVDADGDGLLKNKVGTIVEDKLGGCSTVSHQMWR